jgi:hypothetical protein
MKRALEIGLWTGLLALGAYTTFCGVLPARQELNGLRRDYQELRREVQDLRRERDLLRVRQQALENDPTQALIELRNQGFTPASEVTVIEEDDPRAGGGR